MGIRCQKRHCENWARDIYYVLQDDEIGMPWRHYHLQIFLCQKHYREIANRMGGF